MVIAQDVGKEGKEGLCLVSTECRFVKIPNCSPSWMNDPIPEGMGNYTKYPVPTMGYFLMSCWSGRPQRLPEHGLLPSVLVDHQHLMVRSYC